MGCVKKQELERVENVEMRLDNEGNVEAWVVHEGSVLIREGWPKRPLMSRKLAFHFFFL